MRLPAFLGALRAEKHRPVLFVGVWSGYVVAITLSVLAALAQAYGVMAWSWAFYGLLLAKLATSSLAWLCLHRRRFEIGASVTNIVASLVLFTAAIHLTGGPASPLFGLYLIEVAVLAVLTNTVVAGVAAGAAFALYAAMPATASGHIETAWASAGTPAAGAIAGDLLIAALLLAAAVAFSSAARTRLRARERSLEARAHELVEANKLRAQFTANVTHELRTPIHGVLGLTELLEEEVYGPIAERQRGALTGIRDSSEGLLRQIDDLLEIARAESGRLEVSRSRFSLAEVIERVVSTGAWMKGGKKLSIESDIADDLPIMDSDRGKLVQILVNLLSNAIKFTPEGGRIRISARVVDPDAVAVAVEDTGVGIPHAEQARIFEPFRQADAHVGGERLAARDYGGVGLGLSLVKRLAELLGGTVTVASTVGRGSRFEVVLPIRPSDGELEVP